MHKIYRVGSGRILKVTVEIFVDSTNKVKSVVADMYKFKLVSAYTAKERN